MKIHTFESDFAPEDLPQISGDPLVNKKLLKHLRSLSPSKRVELSQENLVLGAVTDYYFAKYVYLGLKNFSGFTNYWAQETLELICRNLMKQAVISIASTVDQATGRTKSLWHTIELLEKELTKSTNDVRAEKELLKDIKELIDPNQVSSLKVSSIKYVQHMRNKWAGHASLDRIVDSWADGDEYISLPLLEDALVRIINAYQRMSTLISISDDLKKLAQPAQPSAEQLPDGSKRIPLTIDWSNTYVWAMFFQELAAKRAKSLIDQLTSPPNYGHPSDRDISVGSDHDARRGKINEVAALVDFEDEG